MKVMTRMERATATRALSLPRRLNERGAPPRKASVRAAAAAADPALPSDRAGLCRSCQRGNGRNGIVRGDSPARGREALGVEAGHVEADLCDDRLRGALADAGDLVERLTAVSGVVSITAACPSAAAVVARAGVVACSAAWVCGAGLCPAPPHACGRRRGRSDRRWRR